jgi:3,4-dihydroxyphenylacetate 2,3-dioxygenase
MLLGLLGGPDYNQPAEIITQPFGSSGTGQINAIFPL